MAALNVSAHNVLTNNVFGRDLQSEVRCCQAMFAGIYRKKAYPTHQINRRGYCNRNEDKNMGDAQQFGFNITFLYSAKCLFFMCFDKGLKYQLGPTFFKGSSQVFTYVSDCLQRKDYEGLREVMTPELLEKLKKDTKIPPLKSLKLLVVSAANMNWNFDRDSKIK